MRPTLTICINETRIVEHQSAAGITAEKFDRAALDPVQHEVCADNWPEKRRPRAEPNQKKKIQEFGGGFVELRRMERTFSGVPEIRAAIGFVNVTPHGSVVGLP